MNNPIIFFGTEDFSAVSLQKLIDEKFNIVGIVTKPDSKKGRGQKLHTPEVKKIGEKYKIPVLQPQKMAEITDFVQKFENPCGVLVSYGKIIPQRIIDLFTPGIINVHPSLLPKYRGPSPIESAILNGDEKTGISIMQLSAKMDAGPIYAQEEFSLNKTETASELYQKTGNLGAKILTEVLPNILNKTLAPQAQNESKATYCQLLKKSDSILNPENISAQDAENQIRAYEIYPKTKLQIQDFLCIINLAEVSESNNLLLSIKFSDGNFLAIKKLTTPNGKQMDAESFINGYLK